MVVVFVVVNAVFFVLVTSSVTSFCIVFVVTVSSVAVSFVSEALSAAVTSASVSTLSFADISAFVSTVVSFAFVSFCETFD